MSYPQTHNLVSITMWPMSKKTHRETKEEKLERQALENTNLVNELKLYHYDQNYEDFVAANRMYLHNLSDDYVKFGKLVGLRRSYEANAPFKNRKSAMSVMLEHKNKLLPTNITIDPLFRKSVQGKYADSDDAEEIEEPELPRSNRYTFNELGQKICLKMGDSTDFIQTGRTLLNYAEYLKFADEIGNDDDKLYLIPYSEMTSKQLIKFAKQCLHEVKNASTNVTSSGEAKEVIAHVLKCQALSTSVWLNNDGMLILTCEPEKYNVEEDVQDMWDRLASRVGENQNACATPIIVDASIVNKYWNEKEITRPDRLTQQNYKRNLLEASIHEVSEQKTMKQDTQSMLISIKEGLEDLNFIVTTMKTANSDLQIDLLNNHAELASNLQNQILNAASFEIATTTRYESELRALNSKIKSQKQMIKDQEDIIAEAENDAVKNKQIFDAQLAKSSNSISQDLIDEKQREFEIEKEKLATELEQKKDALEKYKTDNEQLGVQVMHVTDQLNKAMDRKQEYEDYERILGSSSKKQRQNMSMIIKTSPNKTNSIQMRTLHNEDSDTDEEEVPSQSMTPKKGHRNISLMTMTPSKAGITKYLPEESTITDWLANNKVQIEYVKDTVDEKQAIRMILMSLPSSLQWVAQTLTGAETTNLSTATSKIIELIQGKGGSIANFMSLSKGPVEHPMAFLIRMRNCLTTTGHGKEDDKFALEAVKEKLNKNLDQTTAVELKRKLGSTSLSTFAQLTTALTEALDLTNGNQTSTLLTSIQPDDAEVNVFASKNSNGNGRQWNRRNNGKHHENKGRNQGNGRQNGKATCDICGKDNHILKNCFYNTFENNREQRTKKSGSSKNVECFQCKGNHYVRDCPTRAKNNSNESK